MSRIGFTKKQSCSRSNGFDYTVKELLGIKKNADKYKFWHGKILSNEIKKYKSSDTVFILGSGPSINSMGNKDWELINNYDSIAFNYWFAHEFIPTFYVAQSLSNDNLINIFYDRYCEYKKCGVPIILRGSDFSQNGIKLNSDLATRLKELDLFYLLEYPISSSCSIDIDLLIKYVEALGYLEFNSIGNFVPKFRSTVCLLLTFAYQMGYKNIVLCGIDMKSSSHFWDHQNFSDVKRKYKLPEPDENNLNTFTDREYNSNTVPDYIYKLSEFFYKKSQVKTFIYNKNTVLYPRIKIYEGNLS